MVLSKKNGIPHNDNGKMTLGVPNFQTQVNDVLVGTPLVDDFPAMKGDRNAWVNCQSTAKNQVVGCSIWFPGDLVSRSIELFVWYFNT